MVRPRVWIFIALKISCIERQIADRVGLAEFLESLSRKIVQPKKRLHELLSSAANKFGLSENMLDSGRVVVQQSICIVLDRERLDLVPCTSGATTRLRAFTIISMQRCPWR